MMVRLPVLEVKFFQHLAVSAAAATLLVTCLLLSSGSTGSSPHLMRREPVVSNAAEAPALAGPEVRLPKQYKEWGQLMRREAKAKAAVAGASSQDAAATGRPAEWGHLMRREAKPVALASQAAPAEWGRLMRREPRQAPTPVLPDAAGPEPTAGTRAGRGFHVGGLLFAGVALVGFALQAKSAAALLLRAPTLEHYWAEGKAK
mmetsp:Transcript_35666/g.82880  ORF Transcript_35666/g.82880 Transcript_35666/m.82880 type:complete len:203 (+) Transcript_35666:74-682(+)